jgi:hypothetical protein
MRVKNSPLFEIARVVVRFDHVASFIVNANYRTVISSPGESPMQRTLRELPYPRFWRTASDCRGKFTAKVDAIKWVGGGNADAPKKGLHLISGGEPRENANCEHTVGSVGLPAFGIEGRVDILHKPLLKIDTFPLVWSIRSFSCCEPLELRIFGVVVIGCRNLDPKRPASLAVLKVRGNAGSTKEPKTGAVPRVVPLDYLVTNPTFMLFL